MTKKIAYLGPSGTFCEEAALRFGLQEQYELIPYGYTESIFAAIDQKSVDFGVVPVENSCEGSVNATLDMLSRNYHIKIRAEIILPVRHCLMIHPEAEENDIETIMSHSQALAQCSEYISKHYEGLELIDTGSTAEACRRIAEGEKNRAAIGTESASRLYGLKIVAQEINDFRDNETRFLVLAEEDAPPSGDDKTSIIVYLKDRPGALYDILGEFARLKLNLTKIESRPSRSGNWDYLFFIDFCGHHRQPEVSQCLGAVAAQSRYLKVLGSYPKWHREEA